MGSFGGSTPKVEESQSSKELARIGKEDWDRFQTDFAPEENKFISDMNEIGSIRERKYLLGQGLNEIRQQASPTEGTSGKSKYRMALAEGSGLSDAGTMSDVNALARKGKGLSTAIGLGRNLATGAMGGLARSSQLESSKNIAKTEADLIKQQGLYELAGTAAGFGLQQYGADAAKYGNTLLGNTYNTDPLSQQSAMLAKQDWGIR